MIYYRIYLFKILFKIVAKIRNKCRLNGKLDKFNFPFEKQAKSTQISRQIYFIKFMNT